MGSVSLTGVTLSLKDRLSILREAIRRIGKPDRFTAGALAVNSEGHSCSPLDPDATACCGVGWIVRVAHEKGLTPPQWSKDDPFGWDGDQFYSFAADVVGGSKAQGQIVEINDGEGLKAVVTYMRSLKARLLPNSTA